MNPITLTIVLIAAAGYLIFQGVKNFQLHSMNTALKNKDSSTVAKIADMAVSRRLLGEYVCDLYKLRSYYICAETELFEKTLLYMLDAQYSQKDAKQSFLETYFHTFLIKGNKKYADWLLKEIRKSDDKAFIQYCEQSYAVMLEERNDLIDEMVEAVNSKRYYGFALGAILYMIAIQYSRMGDDKNALEYMHSAKACLHPRAVYMPVVDKYLREAE